MLKVDNRKCDQAPGESQGCKSQPFKSQNPDHEQSQGSTQRLNQGIAPRDLATAPMTTALQRQKADKRQVIPPADGLSTMGAA